MATETDEQQASPSHPDDVTIPPALDQAIGARIDALVAERLDTLVKERVKRALQRDPAKRKVAIIASKGTLDMAYPPLILATTAAAMDAEVRVFFTFYGLDILKKSGPERLQVAPIGNPAMPVPVPNIVGMLPGMTPMATKMMKAMFAKNNVVSAAELRKQAIELGVKLIACTMTMEVMGIRREDLIDECEEGGAAAFLGFATTAHTTLFI
ncbi:MAG TPA: DsrE/DsrF/DrsH-like family protein [Ktedonobacterales bacterium]|nr:DsrE/DsrF/DrsH-like family protein [Ktedonobacterales bacterium]